MGQCSHQLPCSPDATSPDQSSKNNISQIRAGSQGRSCEDCHKGPYLHARQALLRAFQRVLLPVFNQLVPQPVPIMLDQILAVADLVTKACKRRDVPAAGKWRHNVGRCVGEVHGHQDVCVGPKAGPCSRAVPRIIVFPPRLRQRGNLRLVPEQAQ